MMIKRLESSSAYISDLFFPTKYSSVLLSYTAIHQNSMEIASSKKALTFGPTYIFQIVSLNVYQIWVFTRHYWVLSCPVYNMWIFCHNFISWEDIFCTENMLVSFSLQTLLSELLLNIPIFYYTLCSYKITRMKTLSYHKRWRLHLHIYDSLQEN